MHVQFGLIELHLTPEINIAGHIFIMEPEMESRNNEYSARSMYQVQGQVQYIPRNMHTVFALLCFVVVIHWLIFPYPPGLLHWHCGNLTIAPVPAKQPWWIWINTSCEFIMNDCITTTKQNTTKPCAYFLGYTVSTPPLAVRCNYLCLHFIPVTDTTHFKWQSDK